MGMGRSPGPKRDCTGTALMMRPLGRRTAISEVRGAADAVTTAAMAARPRAAAAHVAMMACDACVRQDPARLSAIDSQPAASAQASLTEKEASDEKIWQPRPTRFALLQRLSHRQPLQTASDRQALHCFSC